MRTISQKLIDWYKVHQRDLPWRHTTDAYFIWLSEIIMQQTQVVQGLDYYLKFTGKYPTVAQLAKAPEDEVMRLWQGLGYYSRARNLHAAAKHIVEKHKGRFPASYPEIRDLKGVGDYTAAAIASFAYGLPHAVVDGNVYRVLSRLFGIRTPINSTAGKKEFQQLADELLDRGRPALHNSAFMEFGALHCRPQNPLCETCPVQQHCYAYQHKAVQQFPVKDKKLKITERYFNYIVLKQGDTLYIRKRTGKGIWQNLYEFLLIESSGRISEEEVLQHPHLTALGLKCSLRSVSGEYKHILTHQTIYAKFYVLEIKKAPPEELFVAVKREALGQYGFPRLIDRFIEETPL